MNNKIEIIYKDQDGNTVDVKNLPKVPRNRPIYKDNAGFSYKSKKSKSSEIKVSYIEPIKEEPKFNYNEDVNLIKAENEKYSISFNKKTRMAEIYGILPPYFSKGFVKGRTTLLNTTELETSDVESIKEDRSMLDLLVESVIKK